MSPLEAIAHKVCDDADTLATRVQTWQQAGEKVVFTNGVFDLLHRGHVHYLAQARGLGDRLVIGVNSDASTKTLNKGDARPFKDEQTRAFLLAALEAVDAVCLFSDHTPLALIEQLKPDVLVKGGDYTVEQIAGHEVVLERGGEVHVLDFLPGHSTTLLEKKIRGDQ